MMDSKTLSTVLLYFVLLLCFTGLLGCNNSDDPPAVKIGALVSLTGSLADTGLVEDKGLDLALSDINRYLDEKGAGFRIELVVEDTQSHPHTALVKAGELLEQGIRIVVGPPDSDSAANLVRWANQNDVLLISPTSSAPFLAIEGDNLFRMMPDDTHQARAIAERMFGDGMKIFAAMINHSVYAAQLTNLVEKEFEALGGTVLPVVRYDPIDKDYSRILDDLEAQIGSDAHGVGIFLISYSEAGDLMKTALIENAFQGAAWYAPDCLALSDTILNDPDAVRFAVEKGMLFCDFDIPGFENHVHYQTTLDSLCSPIRIKGLNAYDALTLSGLLYFEAGKDAGFSELKSMLQALSSGHVMGLGQPIILNGAGDRDGGEFVFWRIEDMASPKWVKAD